MNAHARRRPTLPKIKGQCRLCATPLTGRQISWCSDSCGQLWMAAGNQSQLRGQLIELHGKRCWDCGELAYRPGRRSTFELRYYDARIGQLVDNYALPLPELDLDVDHVRPLWSLDEHERTQPRWWLPFNLQLLCSPCHKRKTKHEAALRAQLRRHGVSSIDTRTHTREADPVLL